MSFSTNTSILLNKSYLADVLRTTNKLGGKPFTQESLISVVKVISVLILRIGFILIQVGSIPIENVYIIIFRNILEMAISIISFSFIGYPLAFGNNSWHGILNYNGFIGQKGIDLDKLLLGICACLIGTAIISSFLVARIHKISVLVTVFVTSSLSIPILLCWIWSENGWMTRHTLLKRKVSIKDYGGNLVIHIPMAAVGLLGTLMLGKRIVKLNDIDDLSIGSEFVSGTVSGYLFIAIGFIGFNSTISLVAVNSILAFGAGILIVCCLQLIISRDIYKYWTIIQFLQGGIAAIVSISAGIDIYSPIVAFGISIAGAFIFWISATLFKKYTSLEDCCSITATYLTTGIIGILCPPLFGSEDILGITLSIHVKFIYLLWQLACSLIVLAVTILLYLLIFGILWIAKIYQSSNEESNHKRSNILSKMKQWKDHIKTDSLFVKQTLTPGMKRKELKVFDR